MSTLQVRPSDCDTFGHVNNGVYASFVQHALADALVGLGLAQDWARDGDYYWRLRSLGIEYRRPAVFGDTLAATIWLDQPDPANPAFGCEIRKLQTAAGPDAQEAICRSRSVWHRVHRGTGEPVPLEEDILLRFPHSSGALPRPFKLPVAPSQVRSYRWTHTVAVSEVETSGRVRPQALYDWVQQAVFEASAVAGWPTQRWLAAGFVVFQMRHDSEFFTCPGAGDSVQITSSVIEVLRLRGTWLHEVRTLPEQELVLRDYSTGIFLDLGGHPAAPPAEMMRAIQFGE